ncbi:MAG: hypothetical protein DI539_16100 [Flavobacterium psychrophilum]|nr:MAG: hypothetical protein DI539_16100 [Flavobacterium psychrophilum]
MDNLITISDIKQYKDIGSKTGKTDTDKITPIITMAQSVDLQDFLGTTFYFDVMNNLENPVYQPLLSGSLFTVGTVTYYQEGLKALLCDLFMSRFVLQVNTNITPFGATTKASQDSTPTDRNTLKDIAHQQKEMAAAKWSIIKLYLDNNTQIFKKWGINNTCAVNNPSGERRRFSVIK